MLSTAGSSTPPPPSPRDQAPLPVWHALRGNPIPDSLLHDRAWLDPPRHGRWSRAVRRLVGRRAHPVPAPSVGATAPPRPAAPSPAPVGTGTPAEVDHPTQEAA